MGGRGLHSETVITKGLTEKVASDQRTEEGEGTSHGDMQEWSIPGGGTADAKAKRQNGSGVSKNQIEVRVVQALEATARTRFYSERDLAVSGMQVGIWKSTAYKGHAALREGGGGDCGD